MAPKPYYESGFKTSTKENRMKKLGMFAVLGMMIFFGGRTAGAQTASAHQITVTWTASTTPNVTYNVYRATAAAGPWTAITTGLSVLTFTDTTATPGTQYFYEVDSVLGTNLSGPSNVANATEPTNPNPPSGLSATAQ